MYVWPKQPPTVSWPRIFFEQGKCTYVAWKQASGSKVKRMHVGMYVHFVVMKWDSKRWVWWFEFSGYKSAGFIR